MDDNISSPAESNIRKRPASDEDPDQKPLNLKGNQFINMPTPPETEESSNASPSASHNPDDMDRAPSPAPSSVLSSVADVTNVASSSATTVPSTPSATAPTSTSGPPPAKRRKLTPSEKLDAIRIKEAKAREKAEEKARKEEEKARKEEEKARKDVEKAKLQALKDEDKRVKDEEKRQKAEEREAKKREKELEEQRKAQSKLDKERSQMRLSGFFQPKPATPAKNNGNESQPGTARRKSLSLEPYDAAAEKIKATASPARGTPPPVSQQKAAASRPSALTDYQRTFLSFVPPSNSTLAPLPAASDAAQERFDYELADPCVREKYDLGITNSYIGIDTYFATASGMTRGEPIRSIKEIVGVIDGTVKQPIDLTGANTGNTALDHLRKAAVRHIEFQQDVRPAYYGTYTKITSPRKVNKFRRNPFLRARPDTDYDNDSEAEWEEPEEGDEEILSEAEDEADSQGDANEIDDFLDDEDDTAKNRRKVATGELVPESTGLCWENESHCMCVVESIETDSQPPAMQGMRIGVLLPELTGASIDPFSAAYWQSTTPQVVGGSMPPPRAPLQPRLNPSENGLGLIGAAEGQRGPITTIAATQNPGAKRGPKPAPRTLSKEDLAEFKEAVVDSPLGKLELQKGLKIRFPKLTNDAIKETLGTQFAQKTGLSKADKKWVYVGDS